jgi:hypothetical protein
MLYLDAALADSISLRSDRNGDAQFGKTLLLGAETLEGPDFFSGYLDELRVWSHVRSQSDILHGKDVAMLGYERGLVALWNFDEVGATIHDKMSGATADMVSTHYESQLLEITVAEELEVQSIRIESAVANEKQVVVTRASTIDEVQLVSSNGARVFEKQRITTYYARR